jgi:hypothetical protein
LRCCQCSHKFTFLNDSEAPRLQGGASRSLIILFRYLPLDPAYPERFRDGACEA